MRVRKAAAADAAAIALIWNHYIRETAATFNSQATAEEEVARAIAGNPCFLVAVEREEVSGFATFSQFRGGIGYAYTMEHTIQLAPGMGGKGIGRALMSALETGPWFVWGASSLGLLSLAAGAWLLVRAIRS